MLKQCLATILAVTLVMATLALLAPAAPAAAYDPFAADASDTLDSVATWSDLFAGFWHHLLGVFAATTCNAEDPCAEDACNPEFCPCSSDPCAENACNPSACTGPGGGTGPRLDPHG